MRDFLPIAIVIAALAAVPLFVQSNVVLNFLVVALMIALAMAANIPSGTRPSSAPAPTRPPSCKCTTG
jgi:hypothetical protein